MMEANELIESIKEDVQNQQQKEEYVPFYNISYEKNGEDIRQVKIDYYKLTQLLKHLGFRRLDIGPEKFIVRIIDNVVEECAEEDVIDTFEEYLNNFGEYLPDGVVLPKLINKIYSGLSSYFSSRILHRLKDDNPIKFNVHTKDSAFFYYENGFVEVTKEGVELRPYSDLEKKIWKNQILPRKFKLVEADTFENSCFYRFIRNIANAWTKCADGRENKPDWLRFESFKGIMGYLLHSFFDGKLKTIVFTDSRISDDASGRTGKTLVMKSLGHILNANKHAKTYIEINGKDFDTKDRFKYQSVGLDTKLMHINDAQRGINIEDLFNDITEGLSRQRKNESPTQVFVKMALSSNRTIRIHGDSARDRTVEFEMADYYSADYSPEKEFKQWFFRDWDQKEWNDFDNCLLHCVQVFLKNGLVAPEAINLRTRKLHEETSADFVAWMESKKIKNGDKVNKKEAYGQFMVDHTTEGYNDYSKWLKQNTFTKWLKIFGKFHHSITSYEETKSNADYFIVYYTNANTEVGESDLPPDWE